MRRTSHLYGWVALVLSLAFFVGLNVRPTHMPLRADQPHAVYGEWRIVVKGGKHYNVAGAYENRVVCEAALPAVRKEFPHLPGLGCEYE